MNRFAQPRTQMHALAGARLALAASVLALLAALVFAFGQQSASAAGPASASAAGTEKSQLALLPEGERPNFVVIQTDDQTLDQLYASYTPPGGTPITAMPNTLASIAAKGMTFNRYYVSYPLCCPSRVSLLTGRYAHNHGVKGNIQPDGGYTGFAQRAAFTHNLAVWLQNSGYRTIHVGKFLNGYGDAPYDDGKTVPPGWSAWHTVLNADTDHYYYGYTENNNGTIEGPYGDSGSWETREYGARDDIGCPFAPTNGLPCYYETDHFTQQATEEISQTPPGQPFYLQLDYTAPHGDFRRPAGPEPAPRHYDWFKGARLPHDRQEGFDEGNVTDKPRFIREAEHLTLNDKHTYRVYWQKQLESLRSVDDGVKEIIDTLGGLSRLRNTYILFTSDNGFFFGEHRLLGGKFLAYEPATHLPFLIRGPGIKPGTSTGELAANIDIAPTILELAHVEADKSVDGRSLVPFLLDPSLRTRRPILFESFVETNDVEENGGGPAAAPVGVAAGNTGGGAQINERPRSALPRKRSGASASIVAPPKDYEGIRLGPYKYIEWPDGEKELYDLNKDPYELNNKARDPNLFPIRAFLHSQLIRLETCVGRTCQEVAPKFPLTRDQQQKVDKERREEERLKQKEREEKKHHKGH
jgi:N-acetylglucosamine-6-sulfatase